MAKPINEKPGTVNILQIIGSGQYLTTLIGLGDDGLLYEWVKSKGKWKQYFEVDSL